jgi:hypothetical protein
MSFQGQLYAAACEQQPYKLHTQQFTDVLAAEPRGSTKLSPKPATGQDLEPVPSTSHPHNHLFKPKLNGNVQL